METQGLMQMAMNYVLPFALIFGYFWWKSRPKKSKIEYEYGSVSYYYLSVKEAKEMMEKEEDFILLDVRNQEDYDKAHLPDSILIPEKELHVVARKKLPSKKANILIYDNDGTKSRRATEDLYKKGYKNVYDIGAMRNFTGPKK